MIQFPRMHIAESALNRLMNALDEQQPQGIQSPMTPPMAPDPTALGVMIEEQVEQPVPDASVSPEMQESTNAGMLESSVMGGSPFDGALMEMGPL